MDLPSAAASPPDGLSEAAGWIGGESTNPGRATGRWDHEGYEDWWLIGAGGRPGRGRTSAA